MEDRIQARARPRRHAGLVAEIEPLVAEYPLRERLWGHLMLAQYRNGCQTDALATFSRARHLLADEYGIDPGPELRDLERRVLAQDPELAPPPGSRPAHGQAAARPQPGRRPDRGDRRGHRAAATSGSAAA